MSWKSWCRLCGNMNEIEIEVFTKNENLCSLSETIQRFFSINICDYDEAPKKICKICQAFLNKITDFSLEAIKVQEMYSELEFNEKFEMYTNCEQIREKYGFQSDNKIEILKEIQYEKIFSDIDSNDDNTSIAKRRKKRNRLKKLCIKEEEIDQNSDNKKIVDGSDGSEFNENVQNNIDDDNSDRLDDINININSTNILKKKSIKEQNRKISIVPIKKTIKKLTIFCEVCNKGFVNQGGYKAHLKIAHQIIKQPESFPCKTCGKVYQKTAQLKIHENTHLPSDQRKLYPCPHCDKKFTVKTSVGGHIRTVHIEQKYFVCEECGKAFATSGRLAAHKVVHTDATPFQCSKCSKSFKCSESLKHHVDSHDDTKYVCPICGTQLNTKRILRRHMIIHSDEKKYKCNFCDKDFKRPKDFKNHLILHTGIKPYQCPFCEQTFANGSNCRKHQKTTHPKELAEAEEAGTIQITKNIPSMQLLKAVNEEAILKNSVKKIK